MSNFLKDTILEYAKDTFSNPNYNPVNVLGGLLARQPQQTEQTNWDNLTVPPDSNYVLIENGVRAKHIPSHFRIFGKFKFFVKAEIIRRPGLTDSALVVSAFQRRDLKSPLVCSTKWMHLTSSQERFTLNIPSNFYECSPRDIGRCIEIRITSSEPGFAGDCMILYGPIQLPIGTAERLKLAAEAGVVEVQCQVQPWKNGPIYQSLRISPRQIIAIPYRGALFQEEEAQLVALPILASTYSVPSMKEPCAFRIKSNQEDIKVIAYNQDDRDLIIMFLQFQVKLKRKDEGRDPLKYDPSINEQHDVEEIIKKRNPSVQNPNESLREPKANKSYADLFYGAPNDDYSRQFDRESFRESFAHRKSYRAELNDTIGNTTKILDQTVIHDSSKQPRASQRIIVLGSPEHKDEIRKLKGDVDGDPVPEKPKLNRAPSFLTKGASVFTTILNTYLQDPKNQSTVTDLMSGWIGMDNSSKITETAQKYIEQNPEAGKELIQKIYSLKQTPPPKNIETVDEKDLELLKKPDGHVGHALLGLLKRVKTQDLSSPGLPPEPTQQLATTAEEEQPKDKDRQPTGQKQPKSIKSDFIEPQQIDTDEEPAHAESTTNKLKKKGRQFVDTAKEVMNHSNKYLTELEELKLGIPWLEKILKIRKAVEIGKEYVTLPDAVDPKDLDQLEALIEATKLQNKLASKDPAGIGRGGQIAAPNSWGSLLDEPKASPSHTAAAQPEELLARMVASANPDPDTVPVAEKAKAAFESFAEVAKHYGKSLTPLEFFKMASSVLSTGASANQKDSKSQALAAPRPVESILEEPVTSPPAQVPLLEIPPSFSASFGEIVKSAKEKLTPNVTGGRNVMSSLMGSANFESDSLPFSNLMKPTFIQEPDADSKGRDSEGTQAAKNTLPSSFGSLGGVNSTIDEGMTQLKRLEIQGILSASEVDNILKLQKTARGGTPKNPDSTTSSITPRTNIVKIPDPVDYQNLQSEKRDLVLLVAELRTQIEELEDRLDVVVNLEGFAKTKIELAQTEISQLKAKISAQESVRRDEKHEMNRKFEELQEELKRTKEELNLSRMRDSQKLSGTQSRIFLADESTQIGSLATRLRSKYQLDCPTLPTEAELAESIEKMLDSYQNQIRNLTETDNTKAKLRSSGEQEVRAIKQDSLASSQITTERAEIEALKQSLEVLKLEKDQNSRALLDRIKQLESQLGQKSAPASHTVDAKVEKALKDKLRIEAELMRVSKELAVSKKKISDLELDLVIFRQSKSGEDNSRLSTEVQNPELDETVSLKRKIQSQDEELEELRYSKDILLSQLLKSTPHPPKPTSGTD